MNEPRRAVASLGRRAAFWFCVLAVLAVLGWRFAAAPAVRTPRLPAARDAAIVSANPARIDVATPTGGKNGTATQRASATVAVTRHAHLDSQGLLPTLGADWVAQIPSLKAAADGADASAAYALFQIFDACSLLPKLRKYDVGDGFANDAEKAHAQANWAQVLAQREDSCRGIDAADIAQRLRWLERAAAEGDESAQTHYLSAALDVLTGNTGDAVRNAEAIVRAKSDGMSYLEQAAARGNTEALMDLSIEYRTNMVLPRDQALSLGYAMAVQRAGINPIVDGVVDRWRANMTDAQIAQAEAHAQRIYASCCAP
ncbi:MAG: hypothetical protein ABI294_01365 [Casimicrobiaceae bacterium]